MKQSSLLQRGVLTMLVAEVIYLVYIGALFFRALSGGFELGITTLNGVTPAQLNGLNPAIMGYIQHLHVALAGFAAATVIAVMGLTWYGVRAGERWALSTAVISPAVGLAISLPEHYMGWFEYDWLPHLGGAYLGTLIFVVGAVMAWMGQARKPAPAA